MGVIATASVRSELPTPGGMHWTWLLLRVLASGLRTACGLEVDDDPERCILRKEIMVARAGQHSF
jgi:hypothetical protein